MTTIRALLVAACICAGSYAQIVNSPDAADAFAPHTYARFGGSGQDAAQAIVSDRAGSIYVAGTTYSYDLPTRNAAQAESVEAPAMRSLDGGATWQKISLPPTSRDISFLAAHPSMSSVLFAGSADTLYRSADGGQSWGAVFTAEGREPGGAGVVVTVGFDPASPGRIYVYSSAGISVSNDLGTTWHTSAVPWYAIGNPGTGPFPPSIAVDPHGSGALLVVAGLRSVMLSRDGGQTWTYLLPPVGATSATASFDPYHVGRIYLGVGAGATGSLFVSDDWGQTWTATKAQPQSAVTEIVVDPDAPGVLYVLTLGSLLTSDDGAETWKPQPELPLSLNYRFERVTGCAATPWLIATGGWQQLLYSADRGASWRSTSLRDVSAFAGGPGCALYVLKKPSGDAFVAKWTRGQLEWSTYLSGLGQDGATALAVDGQRNVIVAGFTSQEQSTNLLIAKYTHEGRQLWTKSLGAEYSASAADVVVGVAGDIVIVGTTNSAKFPVTPGAARTEPGYGFAIKLSGDGELLWSTYLADRPSSAAMEPDGSLLITALGQSQQLLRLSPTGSAVDAPNTAVKHPSLVRTADDGSVYLAGSVDRENFPVTAGAYASPLRDGGCGAIAWVSPYSRAGDIQVAKLRPGTLELEFSALLGGECGTAVRSLDISPDQRITVGFSTQSHSFDTRGAIASAGFCTAYDLATGVAQLSADGSRLIRSTLLEGCDAINVTTLDSEIFAASADNSPDALVLRVPADIEPGPRIDHIANAFSGTGHGLSPGELVAIDGAELGPSDPLDLGINAQHDLPLELGGAQVFFGEVAAPILRASRNRLVVVAPESLDSRAVTIRVVRGGIRSNEILAPVIAYDPALLPLSFPSVQPGATQRANARNADGTLNGPDNPAEPGSLVWVFATGLGKTDPPVPAGAIAAGDSLHPAIAFRDVAYQPVTGIQSMLGFLSAIFAVPLRVPEAAPESGQMMLRLTTLSSFRGSSRRSFSQPVFIYVRAAQ